ncbi:hypothetical protein NE237_008138 [Protea cynaroides]|uniref:Reverse transcriptase zinc-binding domain-containing protein n=1 Tax=Protea cynaroides TaxID=273540 RepID=A0A9Q0KRH7_9MAGN|nr:hypothetical protein NE237_008138 [Protea cynaroides]
MLPSSSRSSVGPKIPSQVWRGIWGSQTLLKIKHFLWHSCLNALASSVALHRRSILVDLPCRRCGHAVEDLSHILSLLSVCSEGLVWVQYEFHYSSFNKFNSPSMVSLSSSMGSSVQSSGT